MYICNDLIHYPRDIAIKLQRRANRVARANGYNAATSVCFGDDNIVLDATQCGYRKNSNGEYVSNSYRNNFGWKNTYYQSAECTVQLMQREEEQ